MLTRYGYCGQLRGGGDVVVFFREREKELEVKLCPVIATAVYT